ERPLALRAAGAGPLQPVALRRRLRGRGAVAVDAGRGRCRDALDRDRRGLRLRGAGRRGPADAALPRQDALRPPHPPRRLGLVPHRRRGPGGPRRRGRPRGRRPAKRPLGPPARGEGDLRAPRAGRPPGRLPPAAQDRRGHRRPGGGDALRGGGHLPGVRRRRGDERPPGGRPGHGDDMVIDLRNELTLYARLYRHARPSRVHLGGLLLLTLLATPIALLTPLPLKIAVDSLTGSPAVPGFLAAVLPEAAAGSPGAVLTLAVALLLAIALLDQLQRL